ncbi:hypothetical protein LV779_26585 [Streptomyces thinghirensis]|nr:hypothetical protein [Streptomyces thinghirensis]
MHRRKNVVTAGLAATVSALALTAAGFAVPAQAAPSAPAAAGVDCDGWVHNNNPDHGIAGCSNNTDHRHLPRRGRLGWAPDVSGQWVTLAPGRARQSWASARSALGGRQRGLDHQ